MPPIYSFRKFTTEEPKSASRIQFELRMNENVYAIRSSRVNYENIGCSICHDKIYSICILNKELPPIRFIPLNGDSLRHRSLLSLSFGWPIQPGHFLPFYIAYFEKYLKKKECASDKQRLRNENAAILRIE